MDKQPATRRGIRFNDSQMKAIKQIRVKYGLISFSEAIHKAVEHYAQHLKASK